MASEELEAPLGTFERREFRGLARRQSIHAGCGGGAGGGARSVAVEVIEVAPDGVHVHAIRDESAVMRARTAVVLAALAMLSRVLLGLARGR